MLGRHDQAPTPLVDLLRFEQHGHTGRQGISARLREAHQQQSGVSPGNETAHVGEIQILGDQKAVSRLCCFMPTLILALRSLRLHVCVHPHHRAAKLHRGSS
jgi:hypothetical protein